MIRFKHPRTFHLPWSLGITDDDKILSSVEQFKDKEIVITEKRDGECTSLYSDGYLHARSVDGSHHPWQSRLKRIWMERCYLLPPNWRLVGENLTASHSILYQEKHPLEVFALFDDANMLCSWEELTRFCSILLLPTVPVLFQGFWDQRHLKNFHESLDLNKQEGYVVRISEEFHFLNYSKFVGKWVRKDHNKTNKDWKNEFFKK